MPFYMGTKGLISEEEYQRGMRMRECNTSKRLLPFHNTPDDLQSKTLASKTEGITSTSMSSSRATAAKVRTPPSSRFEDEALSIEQLRRCYPKQMFAVDVRKLDQSPYLGHVEAD
jgi:hypothetical protein